MLLEKLCQTFACIIYFTLKANVGKCQYLRNNKVSAIFVKVAGSFYIEYDLTRKLKYSFGQPCLPYYLI